MKRKYGGVYALFLLLSVLAALKMLFFAFGLDEEYQLVMSYRNVHGDRLFLDMWEPHQSSAFLCAFLMKPWLALFGTTGIVLYLRLWGTFLHLAVSLYLYRVMKDFLQREYAWLLALIYFNTIPKQMILPEFGIMQVWFYTLTALFLARYYTRGKKLRYLVFAALSLVLNILSYPSCLILFPFLLVLCARFSGKSRWRDMGILTLTCAFCGLGYLGMLFTYTTPGELLNTISHILAGDVTHSLTPGSKILTLLTGCFSTLALWAGCMVFSVLTARLFGLSWVRTCCLSVVFACVLELFCWVILGYGYERMHIHLAAFALAGLCVSGRKAASSFGIPHSPTLQTVPPAPGNEKVDVNGLRPSSFTDIKKFLLYIMAGALLSLLAVTYLTDLSFAESIPHAMPAAFCGAILLLHALEERREDNRISVSWTYAVLFVWCVTAVFGKGYTLRSGTGGYSNVLQSSGILWDGPAAGTISNYMGAYVYRCDYEDWQNCIQDGDKVLIMVDQVMNLGTIQYLFKDVEISHFSIVNPTAYDERLLEYWALYPEKYPNVIIVDCWYGQLMTDPEGWLMQYIENEFGYTQVTDGRYIRIYRK